MLIALAPTHNGSRFEAPPVLSQPPCFLQGTLEQSSVKWMNYPDSPFFAPWQHFLQVPW